MDFDDMQRDPDAWIKRMQERQAEMRRETPLATEPQAERDARYLASVGFGRRYQHPDWEKVFADKRKVVQSYAEALPEHLRNGQGMMLVGGVRCGKTHALALLALAARGHGEAAYILAPNLLNYLHRHDQEARDNVRYYQRVDLLLLDDIDRLYTGGEWALFNFDTFVEERMADMLTTVATVNDFETLRKREELQRAMVRWKESMTFVMTTAGPQGPGVAREGEQLE